VEKNEGVVVDKNEGVARSLRVRGTHKKGRSRPFLKKLVKFG
jgi:hypothetical protein